MVFLRCFSINRILNPNKHDLKLSIGANDILSMLILGIAHLVIGDLDVFSSVLSSPPSFTLSFLSDFQIYKSQKSDRNQIRHIYLAGIRKLTWLGHLVRYRLGSQFQTFPISRNIYTASTYCPDVILIKIMIFRMWEVCTCLTSQKTERLRCKDNKIP